MKPILAAIGPVERITRKERIRVTNRYLRAQRSARPKAPSVKRQTIPSFEVPCPSPAGSSFRNLAHSMGVRVKETNRLIITAKATVSPNELKNRPTMPPMKATGTKMTTKERLVASTARAISEVPSREAVTASFPYSSMWRKMFSCTTTASSMTMPMARIRPSMVMLLRVKPM